MTSDKVKIISRTVVFEGWHTLEVFELQPKSLKNDEWTAPMSREILHTGKAVVILLYNPEDDTVLMNEQFRAGPYIMGDKNPWMLECCAGMIDGDEDPAEAARRETVEETGSELLDLYPIGTVYPSPGGIAEMYYLYCGRIASGEHGGFYGLEEEGEEIRTHIFSADEIIRKLDAGDIHNAGAMLCLQWFARHRDMIRKKWLSS